MPSGRVCEALVMTAEEKQKLESWARRPKTTQRLALRARIILKCATGMLNQEVARELRLDVHTVGKWRERFRVSRLEGLAD
ncbi:MAG TPA: helix-turn-helix domain-containing protein, partial [Candidatus Acidoferrum sp.]|nr:helix-turn-helix domain-containing protein [Candidatus Acidoferrum sp.]